MTPGKKRVVILGSTGSVGFNTLRVIREFSDRFQVVGLAAASRADVLKEQIEEFSPAGVYLKDAEAASGLSGAGARGFKIFTEKEGLQAFSSSLDFDILVAASSGTGALGAVLDALEKGRRVALANKEILVTAGNLVMSKIKESTAPSLLLPVDSEHSAIFQCLEGRPRADLSKIILTSSGGPLWNVAEERFAAVSKQEVMNHPKWKMGPKISVDSATMMNKGLEIIEARWLFGVPVDRIDVLIHPEAVVHSMVEFQDGAILAQLGITDMRLPIQFALCYPDRVSSPSMPRVDFNRVPKLTFSKPDRRKFPCLDLAYQAGARAGSAPCVLCAADETAVEAYLDDKINFLEIPRVIETVLARHRMIENPDLGEILSAHDWAVQEARKLCGSLKIKEGVG